MLELLELVEHDQGSVIAVNVPAAASSCGVAHAQRTDAHQLVECVIVVGLQPVVEGGCQCEFTIFTNIVAQFWPTSLLF